MTAADDALVLPPEALRRRCAPDALGFTTTAELAIRDEAAIQARAREAVEFALGLKLDGYNIFAVGPVGVGKETLVQSCLERSVATMPPADDWCYVFNFADSGNRPGILRLPAGRGSALQRDMTRLIDELRVAIPAAFDTEDYRRRRQMLEERAKALPQQAISAIEKDARSRNIAILRMPMGMALAYTRNGEVVAPEDFARLQEDEQARIKVDMAAIQDRLQAEMRSIPRWESELRQQLRELNREIVRFAISHMMADLTRRFADLAAVLAYLKAVESDLIENAEGFLDSDEPGSAPGFEHLAAAARRSRFHRYEVNLIVDNGAMSHAPIVREDHPTLANLVGRIEYRPQLGAMVTDFTLIKPGALHRANGGYLVLDARRVLSQPLAWEELKRALRAQRVRIESLGEAVGLATPVSLDPEPIPLSLKVVLLGDRLVHHLLSTYDLDLRELFKITADFDDRIERDPIGERAYADLVASIVRRDGLRPFGRTGVAAVIEHGSRLAGDAEKLSATFEAIADLVREANHFATGAGDATVEAAHVARAVAAQEKRGARVRDLIRESIRRGTLLIDVAGARIGQVNGLVVAQLGAASFGWPTRITARARLGAGKVIDIEREVELGGPIHSKGVLILTGFLGGRYARGQPLAVAASLVFEQSYGGVEGDSASLAELCALLSAIGQVPLRQGLAITGSVNQHGVVQPIGGINEKIEGFFDICAEIGFDGTQGVIVPRANATNLMLRSDVVEAVGAGRFRIHVVTTVDEAMALLTGRVAGDADLEGRFPPDSVNGIVSAALDGFSAAARRFAAQVEPGQRG